MSRKNGPYSCLSTEWHDDRISDVTMHYFGCIKACHQQSYFQTLPQKSKRRVVERKLRVRRVRSHFEAHSQSDGGVLLEHFKNELKIWRELNDRIEPESGRIYPGEGEKEEDVDGDVMANMIYFRKGRPYHVPGIDRLFPNQKLSVKDLLADEEESNPLMQKAEEGVIRYFHFPANNMDWVERAISRYYREERPKPEDARFKSHYRTKTQMLMANEYWKGQVLGTSNSEVHSRSMRPLCEDVVVDACSTQGRDRNLVLFMPYLHWETDQGREERANVVREASKSQHSIAEVVIKAKTSMQAKHSGQIPPYPDFQMPNTTAQPLEEKSAPTSKRALAEIFRLAANLAVATESYIEKKLMFEYLHNDPPLQPRRTLAQSYYGALRDTKTRDRDQVIHRATTTHKHDCIRKISVENKCEQCQDQSKKVARLVMVDQLWMWILDEQTVITCYPRRWGKPKSDPSAVHKSLRTRLKYSSPGTIRSAFDLGLLIIDTCSRVFFDRSLIHPRHQLPPLVDIFADSIREMTHKQTAAFDQFLTYTRLASSEYNGSHRHRHDHGNQSGLTQSILLNISLEGNLFKEVKDILDELHIMIRIKEQQQEVALNFCRNVEEIVHGRVHESEEAKKSARWTLRKAEDLMAGIEGRIGELKALKDAAKNTSAGLKDLLTLKQQQAGIVEAREAVKQTRETSKQGRLIMLFTVMTVIFLPLLFFASIFSMNSKEFVDGGLLTLRHQVAWILPVSLAIIATSFLFTFTRSEFLSSLWAIILAYVRHPFHILSTWFIIHTGLPKISISLRSKAEALKNRDQIERRTLQVEAKKRMVERKNMDESKKEDGEMVERKGREKFDGTGGEKSGSVFGRRRQVSDVERAVSRGSQAPLYHFSPRVS